MKTITLLASFLFTSIVYCQIKIIPQPAEIKPGEGFLTIQQPIGFIYNDDVPGDHGLTFFKEYLEKYYKISQFTVGDTHSYGLPTEIFIDYSKESTDGYELTVHKKGITIGGNERGLFYAFQTLIQLLPIPNSVSQSHNSRIQIPCVTIKDYPRFGYRGLHLDVSRHFMPISTVKKYIDYMALHKLNYFHWHLTDDQGWRIEIKKYPRLTSVGGWRNGTIVGRYPGTGNDNKRVGGFYTQEQAKEIVRYAADRYITIVPEIEMPGHGSAAIAAYNSLSCFPEEPTIKYFPKNCTWSGDSTGKQVQQTWGVFSDVFCAGKDETFKFIQDVIEEIIPLFPGKYIHVGGDECPKENWKRCPNCQQRMKDNKLKDEHELQSYFIQRMEKYINGKGKTLIGWDEILEGGLAPNAVVMSWRGEEGGIEAAKQNHNVIMTPGNPVYFDHTQSENEDSVTIGGYNPIEKVYAYEPIPAALNDGQGKFILGAQANLWTEYIKTERKVEYMIFPRLAALSEVLWSPKEKKNWEDFEKRLTTQFKRYDLWKANYSKAYFDLKATVIPAPDNMGVLWKLESKLKDGYIGYSPSIESSLIVRYSAPIKIQKSASHQANYFISNLPVSSVFQRFFVNKATGKKITLTNSPSSKYPGHGAFTLVNGVQNEKGLARSKECLGFEAGADCEAVVDLGSAQTISKVVVHSLSSGGSWVYPPGYVEVFISNDGRNFSSAGKGEKFEMVNGTNGVVNISFSSSTARYIKVFVKNFGTIPQGMPGAGNGAWLFVDEIEVN